MFYITITLILQPESHADFLLITPDYFLLVFNHTHSQTLIITLYSHITAADNTNIFFKLSLLKRNRVYVANSLYVSEGLLVSANIS